MKPMHLLVVLIVAVVIFGASRLPNIIRHLGKSARILKEEVHELAESSDRNAEGANDAVETLPASEPHYLHPEHDER